MQIVKPLLGVKVIELEGIGPAPFAGWILAQLGAEVTVIKRPIPPNVQAALPVALPAELGQDAGKTSVTLDLKTEVGQRAAWDLINNADALIEGLRPGAIERMGFTAEALWSTQPALIIGRMTGWGQTGPWAQAAGHDLNYLALTGLLPLAAREAQLPIVPPTVMADATGGLGLAFGVVSGVLSARTTGKGMVVDAAMLDIAAMLGGIMSLITAAGVLNKDEARPFEHSPFHGSPFYDVYRCADGKQITLCALEPPFYLEMLQRLGLTDVDPKRQFERADWPALKQRLSNLIANQPRSHWDALLAGTDVCYAPVLSFSEVQGHEHNNARGLYQEVRHKNTTALRPTVAPRFMA